MPEWRFQCPDCGEQYDQHVCIDGVQGCCPGCEQPVRDRALRPDADQSDLGRWQ